MIMLGFATLNPTYVHCHFHLITVIPAQAGIHYVLSQVRGYKEWIPACAGMTAWIGYAKFKKKSSLTNNLLIIKKIFIYWANNSLILFIYNIGTLYSGRK
jgi:hypothetical protein